MTDSICMLEQLQKHNEELVKEVAYLKEQLAWFKRQIFGKRSEKELPPPQETLHFGFYSNIAEEAAVNTKTIKAHERKTAQRQGQNAISLPPDLPVERKVIDIPEEQKVCQETGLALVKIGEEITQKIAHKPGSYYIKEWVRPKYALPAQATESGIRIANLPDGLLVRCQADESLLAELITKKFADHLPLYRISDSLAREDIHISRQILCQWVMRAGKALKPLYEEMRKQVIESGNVFMDESPINMQDPGKGKVHQAYMWVLVGGKSTDPPYKIYNFRTDRKHSHAKELLQGYQGVLHSDKYGAYQSLAGNEAMVWCPCWAHIRRKFFEAEYGDPQFRQWILRKIRYLFLFERIAWARPPEERLRIRREKEVPIIDAITEAVKKKLREGSILPKSKFSEALGYYCGLIPQLKNYTEHAYARIDNNVAERAIRPLAIGRKNWLFVGNEEGGEVAGILFSLIQTCRGIGINPREYLEDIMRRLLDQPANKLYELLPDHWAAARSKSTVSPSSLI